jgi:hypothetical protein
MRRETSLAERIGSGSGCTERRGARHREQNARAENAKIADDFPPKWADNGCAY